MEDNVKTLELCLTCSLCFPKHWLLDDEQQDFVIVNGDIEEDKMQQVVCNREMKCEKQKLYNEQP